MVEDITHEEFDTELYELVLERYSDNPTWLMEIPGVYELVAEHLNNDVIERIQNGRKAEIVEEKNISDDVVLALWPTD